MSQSLNFYKNEVCFWRGVGAVGVSAALMPAVTFTLAAVLSVSLFAPFSWLYGVLWMLLSVRNWFYVVVMVTIFVLISASKLQFFTVVADYGTSRLSRTMSLLQVAKLLHALAQTLACAAILWCLLGVVGGRYRNLAVVDRETGVRYLNEGHVFILLHAGFTGLVAAVYFFVYHQNVILYPLIQQPKWNAGRDRVLCILKDSLLFVVRKVVYFYALYYLFLGALVRRWLGSYLTIRAAGRVDSVWGMLDVHLFGWACMTGTVLTFSLRMFVFIYTLYQTEPYEMTIQAGLEGEGECKLADSLTSHSFPLFQFQGYQDLCLLSKQSATRRASLFSLSPLGGHPHNWSEISDKCLSSLNGFTQQVKQFNASLLGNGIVGYTSSTTANGSTAGQDKSSMESKPPLKRSLKDQILNNLQQRKALSYFLSTPPDVAVQQLLAHAQKHCWNVQALSNLVIASYTEDQYGVVQKSLADVITALVTLRDETEKLCKLTGSGGRGDWESDPHTALRASLKSALYHIVNTFAPHLEAIQLSTDVKKKVRLFVEYKV